MPQGSSPYDVPAENQSFLGANGMAQSPTDNLAGMGLRRDPVSGQFTYHSTIPPSLTAEQLGSMPFGELQGYIYRGSEEDQANWINAELAKQAEQLNIGQDSFNMSQDALEGFGDRQRRQLRGSYEQQLSRIDPRLSGTTISSSQRSGLTQSYNQASTDLEQQITEATVGIMRPEYRNMQDIIGSRTDTGPDMNALNELMFKSGMAGRGSQGPDTPDMWQSLLGGAAMNWATSPNMGGFNSPLNQTINSMLGRPGGWGDVGAAGQGAGQSPFGSLLDWGRGAIGLGGGSGMVPGGLGGLTIPGGGIAGPAGMGLGGGAGGLGGGIGSSMMAAAPFVGAAIAAYLVYENNRDKIDEEVGRVWDQATDVIGDAATDVQHEFERGGKRVEKEYKRGVKKVEQFLGIRL